MRRKKVLITAGPTREWMDPVRYLTNPSSGAMGISLAQTLARRGVRVTLVLGPTCLKPVGPVEVIRVETALEMMAAVKKNGSNLDAFIGTAAVGDWRFVKTGKSKLKKSSKLGMTVRLLKNPDILASAHAPIKIGFALETEQLRKNGLKKLREKNADLLIANSPDSFSSSFIRPLWMEKTGLIRPLPRQSKEKLSQTIARWLEQKWKQTT